MVRVRVVRERCMKKKKNGKKSYNEEGGSKGEKIHRTKEGRKGNVEDK